MIHKIKEIKDIRRAIVRAIIQLMREDCENSLLDMQYVHDQLRSGMQDDQKVLASLKFWQWIINQQLEQSKIMDRALPSRLDNNIF